MTSSIGMQTWFICYTWFVVLTCSYFHVLKPVQSLHTAMKSNEEANELLQKKVEDLESLKLERAVGLLHAVYLCIIHAMFIPSYSVYFARLNTVCSNFTGFSFEVHRIAIFTDTHYSYV